MDVMMIFDRSVPGIVPAMDSLKAVCRVGVKSDALMPVSVVVTWHNMIVVVATGVGAQVGLKEVGPEG